MEDNAGEPLQNRKRVAFALAAILILGAVLRLYNLGAPSIQGDEAYHAVVASTWARTGSPLPPSGRPYTRGMPLILLDTLSVRFLPFSLETCVRLPGALLGILNIGLIVLLGRRYRGWALGLAAGMIFAVSPWCVHWARTARMYEFLLTATLLTFLAYARFTRAPRSHNLALLIGALFFAVSTHALGIILIFLPVAGLAVNASRHRVAASLAIAAGFLIAFWELYPLSLSALIPDASGISSDAPTPSAIAMPSLKAFRMALDHAPWLWSLGGLTVVFVTFRVALKRDGICGFWAYLALLGIVLTGISGMLMASALILGALFAWSGCCPDPSHEIRRLRLCWLTGFASTIALWVLLAIAIALHQDDPRPVSILKQFSHAFIYPDIIFSVLRPLLISPRTTLLVCIGLIGVGLILWRVLREGSLVPQRPSLTTRILFLLASIGFIGIANSYYRVDKYLYFLLPVALLSFLEAIGALASKWPRMARACLLTIGVLFVGFHELPAAVFALPRAEGSFDPPKSILQIPALGLGRPIHTPRAWRNLDYRAAGEILHEQMHSEDLLLADSAHEIQVYVPEVHGHLAPPLREYATGDRHYFTGSRILRTPADLIRFFEEQGDRKIWVVLTGYKSVWTDTLPSLLVPNRFWVAGDIAIYAIPAAEFSSKLRERLRFGTQ